jgi:hypothetical protein
VVAGTLGIQEQPGHPLLENLLDALRDKEALLILDNCEHLNVWCEMGSPSQQIGESEPGSSEALVEPDAEVVQRYPGRQSYPQSANVVGTLSAKAEGVVQLLLDGLYYLTDGRSPASQPLWPTSAASIAFWRADDARSVEIEPPPMVFLTFEAFVSYVRT